MKELLHQYAAHNAWANRQLIDVINRLTPVQIEQPIISSFPSIYKTVLHLLDAETIWWQRLKLWEHVERPSESFTGDFNELQQKLINQSMLYEQWTGSLLDHQLLHVFAYQRSKTEQQKQPVYQTLLHIFNHGSYHRGQLVTMLRQLEVTNIPATDFNAFLRQKNNVTVSNKKS
jgi:uncharacterized damage-inducible protein DinB